MILPHPNAPMAETRKLYREMKARIMRRATEYHANDNPEGEEENGNKR